MKVIGPLPPDIAELMERCEVCNAQATNIVRDILEVFDPGGCYAEKIEPLRTHRFRNEHTREPEVVQIARDPQYYDR